MHNENMYNKMCNLSTEAMEKNCQTLYASQDFNIKLFFFFFLHHVVHHTNIPNGIFEKISVFKHIVVQN